MLEFLPLINLVFVVLFVLFLSIITDRFGPKWAGLISGMPTGTAITLFFIGLEISPAFASQSAIFNLAGMAAMQVFVYLYYKTSNSVKRYAVFLSSLAAVIGYLIAIYVLHLLNLTIWTAILIPIVTTPIFMYVMKAEHAEIKKPVELSKKVLLLRAVAAASFIVAITWAAPLVGPEFSGLFSSFPTTLFPLMLIVHMTYGTKINNVLAKNVSRSHFSMLFYSGTVFLAFPIVGVYLGTLAAYAAAALYLLAFHAVQRFSGRPGMLSG